MPPTEQFTLCVCDDIAGDQFAIEQLIFADRRSKSKYAELSIITCSMSIGLPAALALAPLRMELDPTSLEPEFHALKGKDGKPLTTVYAAKGM